jgi:hypothetical protein
LIQFSSHASRTPCVAMNFGFGHGSWCPVLKVKCVTSGPNLPRRGKKGRIFENFCLVCQIFGSVTPNFVGCRSAESVFWVTGHNPCRIERNCTVPATSNTTNHTRGKSRGTWIPGASEACGPKAAMSNTKGLQRSLGQQRKDKGGTKDRQDLLGGENPACLLSRLC